MRQTQFSRRDVLRTAALAAGAALQTNGIVAADDAEGRKAMSSLVGIQSYPFFLIYKREGKNLADHLDEALGRAKKSGVEGWEHTLFPSEDAAQAFGKLLQKHGMKSESIYANIRLHESDWQKRIDETIRQIKWGKPLGINVLVVNPEPIAWGKPLNKDDAQLKTQASAMQALGERLLSEGVKLAYHIHSPEMRAGAREFHHMMVRCDKKYVGLCADTHWIFRGAENSQAALYDIVELYGERIVSLHLRQSHNGVWSEVLGAGDIDYAPLAKRLKDSGFSGPIINEQCYENGTPFTMTIEEAHHKGREWIREVFGA